MRALLTLAAGVALTGCGLVTVQQDFEPMAIRADRADPPPPRVVLTPSSIEIKDKVQFKLGSAELDPVSFPLLDDVSQVMIENPQIELLQVDGYTDSTGGAKRNRELSQSRAESVMKYMVDKGIDKSRLQAKGHGPDDPIADNTTPEGQEANRRVEFNIVKQGPKKTVVQDD
jgi:OOP family OmpA-OmpF porin